MQIAECRMGEANDEQNVGAIEIGIAIGIGITDCADIREKELGDDEVWRVGVGYTDKARKM